MPSTSSARPPVRATTSGAPPARASRATIPNGSYSEGMTTTPARCTRSRRPVVGQEAGDGDQVGDARHVDLRLQLGEVAAAAADHALDAGDPRAQQPHRRRQDLEALLVLHAAPRDHERWTPPGHLAGRPPRRVDAVGDQVRALGRELEAVDDLADHEPRVGEDGTGAVGEPGLDGVHRARLARRDAPAVLAALGRVERGDERGVVQRRQRVGGPRHLPVVGVDDVRRPPGETGRQLDEVVVRRGDAGDEVVVGQPRQVGAGAQHAHAADDTVGGRPRVAQREQGDVVAGGGQRLAQPVDVRPDPADRPGRELPGQHQDPHGADVTRVAVRPDRGASVHSPSVRAGGPRPPSAFG